MRPRLVGAAVLAGLLVGAAAGPALAQDRRGERRAAPRAEPRTVRIMHGHVHVDGRHAGIVDIGDARSAARTIRTHAPEVAERAARQRAAHRLPHGHRKRFLLPHPRTPLFVPAAVVHGRDAPSPAPSVSDAAPAPVEPGAPPAAVPEGLPRPAESAPEPAPPRPEDPERARPEGAPPPGPCLALTVRLTAGALHRLRVSGGSLDAWTADAARERLERRLAGGWPLVLRGVGGRGLAAPASLVEAVEVEEVEPRACLPDESAGTRVPRHPSPPTP